MAYLREHFASINQKYYRMYKSVRHTVSGYARGKMKGDTGYPTEGGKGEGVQRIL